MKQIANKELQVEKYKMQKWQKTLAKEVAGHRESMKRAMTEPFTIYPTKAESAKYTTKKLCAGSNDQSDAIPVRNTMDGSKIHQQQARSSQKWKTKSGARRKEDPIS